MSVSGETDPAAGGTIEFRARLVRKVGIGVGIGVIIATTVVALTIPHFTVVSRAGFVVLGILIAGFCWREASVRITAEPHRVVVRNLFTTTTLEWPEVLAVSFPEGNPWAHLDLADGETLSAMAIQRSDGERGIQAARLLQRLVRERGEAPEAPHPEA